MLRVNQEAYDWSDEELEALVSETSGYDAEEGVLEYRPRQLSSRRRIEELRELRRLRASLEDFDEFEDDIDDDFMVDEFEEEDEDDYQDEWN